MNPITGTGWRVVLLSNRTADGTIFLAISRYRIFANRMMVRNVFRFNLNKYRFLLPYLSVFFLSIEDVYNVILFFLFTDTNIKPTSVVPKGIHFSYSV